MQTSAAVRLLSLALISGSSCYAARPVHHGISPAALAVVRPVFVPWMRCNKIVDHDISLFQHGDYHPSLYRRSGDCDIALSYLCSLPFSGFHYDVESPVSSSGIMTYCDDTNLLFPTRRVGRLVHNAEMNNALESLGFLLLDKVNLLGELAFFNSCVANISDCAYIESYGGRRPEEHAPVTLADEIANIKRRIAVLEKDKGLATRFWYDLDYTA